MTGPGSPILIVEDSETQALQLRYLLEEQGWDVIRASTGESALDELNRQRPALIIADYHLPGIQGDELCRRVRMNVGNSWHPDPDVNRGGGARQRARRAGQRR